MTEEFTEKRNEEQQRAYTEHTKKAVNACQQRESLRADLRKLYAEYDKSLKLDETAQFQALQNIAITTNTFIGQTKILIAATENIGQLHTNFRSSMNVFNRIHAVRNNAIEELTKTQEDVEEYLKEIDRLHGLLVDRAEGGEAERPEKPKLKWKDEEDKKKRKREQVDYFDPLLDRSMEWVCCGEVGSGGMGSAVVWVQVNDEGKIQDRIVRKDLHKKDTIWDNEDMWHLDSDEKMWYSMEFCTQQTAQRCEGASNVVRVRKEELKMDDKECRIYVEFCPFGNLEKLILQNNAIQRRIPEAWMWMAFSALVDCGLVLEQGGVRKKQIDFWQIIHRDMKPKNIFIDLPRDDDWPRYAQPKLGDFGLAIVTHPDDEENPELYLAAGTKGYRAPEQTQSRWKSDVMVKILSPANVWGIGRVMYDIVAHDAYTGNIGYDHDAGGQPLLYFREGLKEHYSKALISMIKECMVHDPADRPLLQDLRSRIDSIMVGAAPSLKDAKEMGGLLDYMNAARKGNQKEDSVNDLGGLPREAYKIGMILQDLKDKESKTNEELGLPGYFTASAGVGAGPRESESWKPKSPKRKRSQPQLSYQKTGSALQGAPRPEELEEIQYSYEKSSH